MDPTLTSLSGHAEQLKVGKYNGGITRFETSIVRQSAGFDVNDLGFLRRADLLNWSTWSALSWREQRWIYRWAQLNANHWMSANTTGDRYEHGMNVNGHMGLLQQLGHPPRRHAHAASRRSRATAARAAAPMVRNSGGFFPWGGVNTDAPQAGLRRHLVQLRDGRRGEHALRRRTART